MTLTREEVRERQRISAAKRDIHRWELRRRFGSARVTNVVARLMVRQRERFHGNNLYGEWRGKSATADSGDRYVVTSYGDHWPLFIWEDGTWYENVDKYSVTTSKHRSQAHPHEETMPMTCEYMRVLMHYGIVGVGLNMGAVKTS